MPPESTSLRETISQCNADEWDEIVRASCSGILLSHGFVTAVEEAFEDQAGFAHAVVSDQGRAVACGSFCTFPIDLNLLADGFSRRITEILSKSVPSLMRKKIVLCGLPVSVGAKHLAMVPGAQHKDVLRAMHEVAVSLRDVTTLLTSSSRSFPMGIARGSTLCASSGTGAFRPPP